MTAISAAAATFAAALSVMLGATGAWWLHRRTRLSPRNAYLAWRACDCAYRRRGSDARTDRDRGGALTLLASHDRRGKRAAVRVTALGAGGELRDHERARVMAWTALRDRARAEASGSRSPAKASSCAGAPGPSSVRALPMTGDGRAPLPLEEGHHHLYVGATGSGQDHQRPPRAARARPRRAERRAVGA